eukprot:193213_1
MSNAIKVKKENKKTSKPAISQSIPAHFYKNYIPPKTPQINPIQPPAIPDFEQLPKISPTGKGINIKQGGSYSLTRNKHPMSMPVRHGIMGPNTTPFTVNPPNKDNKDNETESKVEPNSLEKKNKQLKVGSFTCFDIMTSPLKQLPESGDQKDNASATSQQTASTFASDVFEDGIADEPDENEDSAGKVVDSKLNYNNIPLISYHIISYTLTFNIDAYYFFFE